MKKIVSLLLAAVVVLAIFASCKSVGGSVEYALVTKAYSTLTTKKKLKAS